MFLLSAIFCPCGLEAQWAQQPQFHTTNTLTDVRVLPDGRGIVTGEGNVLLCTLDEGEDWDGTGSADPDLTAASLAEGVFYFANRSGAMFRETNPAECDNELLAIAVPALSPLLDLHMLNASQGYAVGGGILRYTDNTWSSQTTVSNLGCPSDARAIWFLSPEIGYAVTDAGRIVRITRDGGTFLCESKLSGSAALRAIHFADTLNGCAVGVDAVAWVTTDGGENWMARNIPADDDLNAVSVLPGDVLHAGGEQLYVSEDAGMSWQLQSAPVALVRVTAMWFANQNRGWITGPGGFIGFTANGGGGGIPLGMDDPAKGNELTLQVDPEGHWISFALDSPEPQQWQLLRSDGVMIRQGVAAGTVRLSTYDLPRGSYLIHCPGLGSRLFVR